MFNVTDCQVEVLLERHKSMDDGQWINPGQAKRDEQDRRRLQRSVDAKTFKKAQKQKSVPKLSQPLNDDKERNTIRNQHVKDKDNKTKNSNQKENKEN